MTDTTVQIGMDMVLLLPKGKTKDCCVMFTYVAADPYAVTLTFFGLSAQPHDDTSWTFARSLLTEGVSSGVSGTGDVRFFPREGTPVGKESLQMTLSSPSGKAIFSINKLDLANFLARTYELVPVGAESEHFDMDTEMATLMNERD